MDSEQDAVEAALDAIVTIDVDGIVRRFNPSAERMFGYSREEALGQPVVELLVPPDLRELYRGEIQRLTNTRNPPLLDNRIETTALRRGGERFPAELIVARTAESPLLFNGFLRDLSLLKAAEDRGRQMQRILSAAERLAGMGSWELDLRTGHGVWSDEMYRLRGFEPQSVEPTPGLLLEVAHADDRERVRGLMQSVMEDPDSIPAEGVTFEFRTVRPDGSVREIRARGRIERDDHGVPATWLGSAQDVTEQRLAERELYAHYALNQALRDWESFDEGVVTLLRRLGTALELPMGSLWTCDRDTGKLRCRAFWRRPDVDTGDFEPLTRATTFAVGQGVPGRVWETGEPAVVEDVGAAFNYGRRGAAEAIGLRSGLVFPAVADDGTLAVLTYFSFDRRTPSERFLRTLTGIGDELGRFLSARRGELETRRLSAREMEVLELAAEGLSGPAIAERLIVSPSTIKTHFEHVYEKLGVSDRASAVAHGLRTGLFR
jgi:PAS domain S-box-containing protein